MVFYCRTATGSLPIQPSVDGANHKSTIACRQSASGNVRQGVIFAVSPGPVGDPALHATYPDRNSNVQPFSEGENAPSRLSAQRRAILFPRAASAVPLTVEQCPRILQPSHKRQVQ